METSCGAQWACKRASGQSPTVEGNEYNAKTKDRTLKTEGKRGHAKGKAKRNTKSMGEGKCRRDRVQRERHEAKCTQSEEKARRVEDRASAMKLTRKRQSDRAKASAKNRRLRGKGKTQGESRHDRNKGNLRAGRLSARNYDRGLISAKSRDSESRTCQTRPERA